MKPISEIDTNFVVDSKICRDDLRFYDVRRAPFRLYGVTYANGRFRRMPEAVARTVSQGVFELHTFTSGGRVRFRTDSPYVAIYTKMPIIGRMPHCALTGSSGFDLYVADQYQATFTPPFDMKDGYESLVELHGREMREITVHMPLYSEVSELSIGLAADATVEAPTPYRIEQPVVFYGSSITQGGCASRPGTSYDAMACRRLNINYHNLGFSGNARGEDAMADYVRTLPMSAFVYDYDHNAPTVEHLRATHERMFRTVREANPTLPILILQRPVYRQSAEEAERLAVLTATYEHARAAGDTNVYLITGRELMALAENDGTVDGCHPTDLGFASMAKAVGDRLATLL